MEVEWSDLAKRIRFSEIRELLKYTEKPGIISFAGGLPGPEAFPTDEIAKIIVDILKNNPSALQYCRTEGLTKLREQIAELATRDGIKAEKENILITSGAQQAIDILLKSFLNPGDGIIIGAPTYLAFWQAAEAYGAEVKKAIRVNRNGIDIGLLEDELEKMTKEEKEKQKIFYDVPTFSNPSATEMPEKNRKKLINIAQEHNLLIFEDDPYSKLRYEGDSLKPVKSFDDSGHVIYIGTFSKTVAPGLRIGYVIADENVIKKLTIVKQPIDLCSNTLGQHIISCFLEKNLFEPHIEKIRECYKKKRDVMLKAMDNYFPSDVKWQKPRGGIFNWLTAGHEIDSKELLKEALERNVAYVPGAAFFSDERRSSSLRVNFSHSKEGEIERGIQILGELLYERGK